MDNGIEKEEIQFKDKKNKTEKQADSRVAKAERLFREGYNCAQAVVAAYCDIYGMDEELGLRIAASFGAGLGRMREVCGAVSGMAIIAGLENGSIKTGDSEGKKANYDLTVKLVEEFKKKNGTIICRELLGLDKLRDRQKVDTTPQVRDENYYKTRPCVEKVIECANILEQVIMKEKL